MLEKLTLLSNERTMTQLLTQDDFNYNPYNEHIFSLNLVMDSIDEFSNESGDEDGEAKDDAGEDDIF